MFKSTLKLCTTLSSSNICSSISRNQVRSRCTAVKQHWDVMTAICVERHPVITQSKTEIEEKFHDLLNQIQDENSMKSDHELRLEAEEKQDELLKKGVIEVDPDKVVTQTAQDLEDAGEAELAKFPFASRLTEADKQNITTSLERKLAKSLMLLVQQKIGNDIFWLPPQGIRKDGESLRQSADRILQTTCGEELQAKIYGNAPIGFYKYVYPKKVRENGKRGAKIFYYLAKYQNGNVTEKVKYQWLDRKELKTNLPQPMHKSVFEFLVPE